MTPRQTSLTWGTHSHCIVHTSELCSGMKEKGDRQTDRLSSLEETTSQEEQS